MGSSSSDRINISARTQKFEVDNRFPLRFYFRMADIILRQADVYRDEKDTLYLYITLQRFASLVCETIPDHRDYTTCGQRERSSWKKVKKKLLNSLEELEELNPKVKQKINELNRRNGYQNSGHVYETGQSPPRRSDKKKVESVGTCSSSTGGENLSQHPTPNTQHPTPNTKPFGFCGNKRLKKEKRIKILLEEAHDWKLPTPCRPMPQIHETIASSSSSTSMDNGDLSQHETSPGSHSHSKIHVISTIQTSTTSDSIPASPTPSAPPVSDDYLDDPFQCRSIESTPIQNGESSSCVICMDAAVEGAFIPCGQMAGCMACMNDIKDKNWDCPVCRAKVDQVLRLYAV